MTLKECIDKHGFGVKFFAATTPTGYWFIPLGISQSGTCAIGEAADTISQHWTLDSDGWDIPEKQKKKRKLCTYVHYFMNIESNIIYPNISTRSNHEDEYPGYPIEKYKYLTTVKFAETEVETSDE